MKSPFQVNGQNSLGPVLEPVPALITLDGIVVKHWTASMWSKCDVIHFFIGDSVEST